MRERHRVRVKEAETAKKECFVPPYTVPSVRFAALSPYSATPYPPAMRPLFYSPSIVKMGLCEMASF